MKVDIENEFDQEILPLSKDRKQKQKGRRKKAIESGRVSTFSDNTIDQNKFLFNNNFHEISQIERQDKNVDYNESVAFTSNGHDFATKESILSKKEAIFMNQNEKPLSMQIRRANLLVDAGITEIGRHSDVKKGLLHFEEAVYSNPSNQRVFNAVAHLSMGPESKLAEIGTNYQNIIQRHNLNESSLFSSSQTNKIDLNDHEKLALSNFNEVLQTIERLHERGCNETFQSSLSSFVLDSDGGKVDKLTKLNTKDIHEEKLESSYKKTSSDKTHENILWKWLDVLLYSKACLLYYAGNTKEAKETYLKLLHPVHTSFASHASSQHLDFNNMGNANIELDPTLKECNKYINNKTKEIQTEKRNENVDKVRQRIVVMCVASEERPALTLLQKSFEAVKEEIEVVNKNSLKENISQKIEMAAEFHVLGMHEPYPGHEAKLQKFTEFINKLYEEQMGKISETSVKSKSIEKEEKEAWSILPWGNKSNKSKHEKKSHEPIIQEEIYILAIDAYDVVLTPRLHELPMYLEKISRPIVFAAEQSPWPDEVVGLLDIFSSETQYQEGTKPLSFSAQNSDSNVYLNSGSWCGRLEHVYEVLKYMQNYYAIYASDQRAFTRFHLQHPHLVHLDTSSDFLYTTHYTHVPILIDLQSFSNTSGSTITKPINVSIEQEDTDGHKKARVRSAMNQSKMPAVLHANAGDGKSLYGRLLGTYGSPSNMNSTFMVVNTPYFNGLAMHTDPSYDWYTAMNFIYHLRIYGKLGSSQSEVTGLENVAMSNAVTKSLKDVIVDYIEDSDRSRLTSRYFCDRILVPFYVEAAFNAAFMMMNMKIDKLARLYFTYALREVFDLEYEKLVDKMLQSENGKQRKDVSRKQIKNTLETEMKNTLFSFTLSPASPLFSSSINNIIVLESQMPSDYLEALINYLLDFVEREKDKILNGNFPINRKNLLGLKVPVYTTTVLLEIAIGLFNVYARGKEEDLSRRSTLQAIKKRFDTIIKSKKPSNSKKIQNNMVSNDESQIYYNPYLDLSFVTTPPASLSVYKSNASSSLNTENITNHSGRKDFSDVLFSIDILLRNHMCLPHDSLTDNKDKSILNLLPHETKLAIGGAYLCLDETTMSATPHLRNTSETTSATGPDKDFQSRIETKIVDGMLSNFALNLGYNATEFREVAHMRVKKKSRRRKAQMIMSRDIIINWGRFLVAANEGRKENICPFYY